MPKSAESDDIKQPWAMQETPRFGSILLKSKNAVIVGALGFPIYFFTWANVFPQPYENFWLRLVGSAACLLYWGMLYYRGPYRAAVEQAAPVYCYALIVFCLPFFFTYMALMNGMNAVWMASAVCSVLYLILLLDLRNMLAALVVGTGLGIAAYLLTAERAEFGIAHLAYLPILAYALVGAVVYKYNEVAIEDLTAERMRAVAAVSGSIAHEMRTPLLGIRLDAEGLREDIAELEAARAWALAQGWTPPAGSDMAAGGRSQTGQALERIIRHAAHFNTVIDTLLANIAGDRLDSRNFAPHSMSGTVSAALDAYPFRPGERELVRWEPAECDFTYVGSDILMRQVVVNLVKNGLRALSEKHWLGCGASPVLQIRLRAGERDNRLHVRDNGIGIAPADLARIFEPFHSGRSGGAGIGLAFARRAIGLFGGRIGCRSDPGQGAEFIIELPRART